MQNQKLNFFSGAWFMVFNHRETNKYREKFRIYLITKMGTHCESGLLTYNGGKIRVER